MKTVYMIEPDWGNIQSVLADDNKDLKQYDFDGNPVADKWNPPPVYSPHPTLPAGEFWGYCVRSGVFALTMDAATSLNSLLNGACELLPFTVEDGPELLLCHVTNVVDCLDSEESSHKPGIADWITKYVFNAGKLRGSLFKIPETGLTEVYCLECTNNKEGFKSTVERLGLKGLIFRKLWSDEG